MNEKLLSIRSSNHGTVLVHNLDSFFRKESYCDATLICERKRIKVHKIVLSACSEYFRELFDDIACPHPYIILKDVGLTELEALLEYMYNGKTSIFKTQFSRFLNTADYFRVKGLSVSDSEFCSDVKISVVNSGILSGLCNTVVHETRESGSVPSVKEDINEETLTKEISSTNSSTKISANKANEATGSKREFLNLVKVQKNNDQKICDLSEKEKLSALPSSPRNKNNFQMEPLLLYDSNEHSEKKKNHSLLGESRISKKAKVSDNRPSILSEQGKSVSLRVSHLHNSSRDNLFSHLTERAKKDDHMITRSNKKSSLANVALHLSEGGKSDDPMISLSSKNLLEDLPEKTIESEVPPNFDLWQEPNLNNQNQPFRHNCLTCGFSAKNRTQLVAHVKSHNVQTTQVSKRYRCSSCTFSSIMKSHLDRHVKGHKKPLKCKNCPFRASLNISMKKHEKTCLKGSVSAEHVNIVHSVSDKDKELPATTKRAKESSLKKPCLKGVGNTEHVSIVGAAPSEDDEDELPDISTPAKENPANKSIEKDYFQCAFCSHKTSSESLLTSHVKSIHLR